MMRPIYVLSALLLTAMSVPAVAQSQGRQGLDTIVEPIVPERQIGLPDKAPSDQQPVSNAPLAAPKARKAEAAPARAAQPAKAAAVFGTWKTECAEKAPKPNCQVIVRSAVDLGHNLGMTVVAEGVQDGTAQNRLADMGCDLVQGYQICRPVPARELELWIETHPVTESSPRPSVHGHAKPQVAPRP